MDVSYAFAEAELVQAALQ